MKIIKTNDQYMPSLKPPTSQLLDNTELYGLLHVKLIAEAVIHSQVLCQKVIKNQKKNQLCLFLSFHTYCLIQKIHDCD